jgi:hypothetical protein
MVTGPQVSGAICQFPLTLKISTLHLAHTAWLPEIQELKRQLVIEIRRNHVLDRDLQKLDKRIGLLIKNRTTLQVRAALPLGGDGFTASNLPAALTATPFFL